MARIELNDLAVDFPVPGVDYGSLSGSLGGVFAGGQLQKSRGGLSVDALKDINLTIKQGDRIGLIGSNGAGKSTLLSVLAGVLPPTRGRIHVTGRATSLLSLRAGFEQRASGFANIELRARLMGQTRQRVFERTPEILRFADLGDYIDLPVSTYSSGMKFRLAFAIATAFDPEIILMDEWLSTGDQLFRKKAEDRLNSLIKSASILVIASHSRKLIRRLCNRAILLEGGQIKARGGLDDVYTVFDRA